MASTSSSHQQNAFSGIEPPNKRRKIEESSRVFDVFINHRGPDVKHTLATQLYNSLNAKGIKAFLDSEEKERGVSFISTIETAIRSASVHIAIFSKKYAESDWCLRELVLMLQSKARIIPVFYEVEPWELRYIEKGVYAEAFTKYEDKGRYLDKLKEWKEALQQVSFTAGDVFKINPGSSDCKDIVSAVEKEVQRTKGLHVAKYPVGLHKLVQDFERRCLDKLVQDFESQCGMKRAANEKANVVGIFGMGGVGKTTLSLELFNQKRSEYTKASFIYDVREAWASGKLPLLQSKLLKDIFCEDNHSFTSDKEGTSYLRDRLERSGSLSFLIVLDDIDNVEQLDALLPIDILNKHRNNLVIITTRDVGVLVSAGIDIAYHLKGLDREYGEELFCWHAFKQPRPPSGYEHLVQDFVSVCGGLPLSLIVLGRHLFGRGQSHWRDGLEKVKKTLPGDIKRTLKISIDTLDNVEKQIFMDIACFFIGKSITKAMAIWKLSGWRARPALITLKEKCLVEAVEPNFIWDYRGSRFFGMHDHLRDLGREMADELSHPLRVWRPRDLKYLELKGFQNNLAQTKSRCFHSIVDESIRCRITYFLGEPEDGSDASLLWLQLKYLSWCEVGHLSIPWWKRLFQHSQCLRVGNGRLQNSDINLSIPSWIPLQHLQCLRVGNGRLKTLWQSDVQALSHLKELDISSCHELKQLPSLPRLSCLEQIKIYSCKKLQNIMLPTTLNRLDVQSCKDLQRVAEAGDLTKLTWLIIKECPVLEELPSLAKVSCLDEVIIDFCDKIHNIMLPTTLNKLNVQSCRDLQRITVAGDLTGLEWLTIKKCPALEELPSLAKVSCSAEIKIGSCEKLQHIMLPTTLNGLDVQSCRDLQRITVAGDLTEFICLTIKECPALELPSLAKVSLPQSEYQAIKIESCEKLQHIMLPTTLNRLFVTLNRLFVQSCRDLQRITVAGDLTEFISLTIKECPALEELPSLAKVSCSAEIKIESCEKLQHIMLPTTLNMLDVQSCRDLQRITVAGDLTGLGSLTIQECPALEELPSLAKVSWSNKIEIKSCDKLQHIMLPTTLKILYVQSCRDLQRITGDLTKLTHLIIKKCPALEELPNLAKVSCSEEILIDSCEKLQNASGVEGLPASKFMKLRYCSNALIRNCVQKLKSVPSKRMDMIGRAVDGAESSLNRYLFSDDANIDIDAVTEISAENTVFNWSALHAVIVCFAVVVDSSTSVEDINKSLRTDSDSDSHRDCDCDSDGDSVSYSYCHWDVNYRIKVREGEWIITMVACHCCCWLRYYREFENVLRRYGILKKGFWVEVKKGEEWKSVGVLKIIVDRLHGL